MREHVEARYRGDSGMRYHESQLWVPDAAFWWIARDRSRKLAPYVRPTDHVLEYGAGIGWNLAELHCAKRIGVEPTESARLRLERLGIEYVASATEIPDATVDVVVCSHVLEHVADPLSILAEISRLLRPGGQLLLFVPYEREMLLHRLLFGKTTIRYRHDEPNHHLYAWNVQTLGALVAEAGFHVARAGLGRFGYDRAAALLALRLRSGQPGFLMLRWLFHLIEPVNEVRLVAGKGAPKGNAATG